MPRQTRRARSLLSRAAQGVLAGTGVYHNADPDKDKGGGAPPVPPKKDEPPADDKVTLTKAELDQRIADAAKQAAKDESDKLAKDREREKAEREAEDAKKRGEFEKLYQSEVDGRKKDQAERDALKLDLRRTQVQGKLHAFIVENHADYAPAAKYIAPLLTIAADTTDADADKQIKEAVEQYVKDNPRAKVIGPSPSIPHKLPASTSVPPKPDDQQRRRPVGPAASF
jgi:hypothetical protein